MKAFIVRTLVAGIAILVCAWILEAFGASTIITGYGDAVIAALIIGLLNAFIKPLITLITLPLTVLTLGLFLLVINGIIFYLAGHFFSGFHVDSFGLAFVFSLFYSTVLSFLNEIFDVKEK
ncbi:phage holin family protein [Flammeovirga yaeyamensis]|uniref:Phage holin family protein n=1 Tax=Flammeovirga yaeyamensis TaxID=367791 RepID=A0AAX1NBU4_9BACT|nr:phage holin family protein [Flammeovirga yaeyamensis]MBB3697145.1 putative membrane protein [Flammeovirga yaeyamensis]NMF33806.1 phage holin family protein [Flammeovirga yaeyamensis]QWG04930.1 phage holin family protein [Flammeovirga yaeyamensis]